MFKLSFLFDSDFSFTSDGYYVDDVSVRTGVLGDGEGHLDVVEGDTAYGWACHSSDNLAELDVHVYFYRNGGGTPVERVVRASSFRQDLVDAGVCGTTGNHGWTLNIDPALKVNLGSGTHTVRAFATPPGECGGADFELLSGPKTLDIP